MDPSQYSGRTSKLEGEIIQSGMVNHVRRETSIHEPQWNEVKRET